MTVLRYSCPDCGCPVRQPRRCARCYRARRSLLARSGCCADCGASCRHGARRCRACYEEARRGAYGRPAGRPALRRPPEVEARIERYAARAAAELPLFA